MLTKIHFVKVEWLQCFIVILQCDLLTKKRRLKLKNTFFISYVASFSSLFIVKFSEVKKHSRV